MASGQRSPTCPRCSGTMEPGFNLDMGYGTRTPLQWIEGRPERSFWSGIKLRGKRKQDVTTYRCRRCGYLESYA